MDGLLPTQATRTSAADAAVVESDPRASEKGALLRGERTPLQDEDPLLPWMDAPLGSRDAHLARRVARGTGGATPFESIDEALRRRGAALRDEAFFDELVVSVSSLKDSPFQRVAVCRTSASAPTLDADHTFR